MTDYRARQHYQDERVAASYDAQYNDPIRLSNLRVRVFGWREERVFAHLLRGTPKGGAVLDIPAGTGRYLKHLLDRGHQVGGADISKEMLRLARRRVGQDPNLLFLEAADAASLPYSDGRFDGVVCMRLYHLVPPDERRKMLQEVRRVGKRWAILYFGMRSLWLDLRQGIRSYLIDEPMGNPYPVSMRGLRQELDGAGMHLEDIRWVLPVLAGGMVVRVSW
jgi:ubiquinone/menaquinone biosynthesis C-methylase UbiE